MFNEFDQFKPYRGEEIKDYSLYIVKAGKPDMFFNKQYNLCYGLFLKKLTRDSLMTLSIFACKQPSFVRKVNYANLIDDLWKKEISKDKDEDTIIKKTVANTCFGKLEKGISKKQRSFLFSSYEEGYVLQQAIQSLLWSIPQEAYSRFLHELCNLCV